MDIALPATPGYGRLSPILKILAELRTTYLRVLRLDWHQVEAIAPAGYAIFACLCDHAIERRVRLESVHVKKIFRENPIIKNLSTYSRDTKLPAPSVYDFERDDLLVGGAEQSLNIGFVEAFRKKFEDDLGEDVTFSCQLILNELMQNSLDHSSAERFYMYAGFWPLDTKREIHVGVLDMGVTIPAKLQQKYDMPTDQDYLDLALKEGSTTRRSRPGGLGLFHTFEHLKHSHGTLTILSRKAQLTRYFGSKTVRRIELKFPLMGTWCMARFPIKRDKK